MPVIEFEGKTTEDAIENASNQLHLPKDEIKFEIVSTGSSGIFGLGGKKAKIRVSIEEKISHKKPEPEEREIEKKEVPEKRERRPARESAGKEKPPRERPKREPRKRERPKKERKPGPKPEKEAIFEPPRNAPLPPTVPGPDEEVYDGPEDAAMTKGREATEGILKNMGVEATVTVTRISDRIILDIAGENSGLLIGKKGATLDALQFLVNKIVNRIDPEKYRVVVDTEKYRERRHQSLVDLACRMAEKAKRNKRPVTISQLSAHDRRVVHLVLQDMPGIKTRSRGEGPFKNIIIVPGGKKNGARHNQKKVEAHPRERLAVNTEDKIEKVDEKGEAVAE